MKVEFIVNTDINDGRQIFIEESEFRKAKNNEEEYYSFAFATNCLLLFMVILIISFTKMNMKRYCLV